jgi:MoCo/4Fe-4S cofactor protein with predicted Tat translocation signal
MSERTAGEQNLKQPQPYDQGRREANMANDTTDVRGKNTPAMTLEEARARVAGQTGKKYWRSVDELADTPAFREAVQREFPEQAAEWIDPVSRRGFLKVMSASLALAGLAGCTKQPDELIYPYVKEPEDLVLGRPVYFATAFPFPTGAVPLLVKSDAYRPIKVDGNPDHPVNRGSSDPLSQGSILDLYDPDRSQRVISRGEVRQFAAFLAVFRAMLADKKASGGAGLYILSDTVTSPTLAAQWKTAQQNYPNAKWMQWDPVNRDSAYSASKTAFGDYYDAQYRLQDADVIVSLDADFLSGITHPGFLRLAADYAGRRKLAQGGDGTLRMNRLYAIESTPTTTGFKAEHRLALKASEVALFASALAAAVGAATSGAQPPASAGKLLAALAADLKASAGKCVVIPGEQQPPSVHLAAIAINQALGNVGKTVVYTETVNPMPSIQGQDIVGLVNDMRAGKVDWLLILNANPVYTAPVDLHFAEAMANVKMTAHLGSHLDETGVATEWHINGAHYLENWSDTRAYDGTATVIQPMIDPLYAGKSAHEVIQSMLDDPDTSGYDAVRKTWQPGTADKEHAWRKILHDGMVEGTAFQPKTVSAKIGELPVIASSDAEGTVEVIFRADPNIYDGRYANVGWLQEIPKPVNSISWDNAALMGYRTLAKFGLAEQDIVAFESNGNTVMAPVIAVPGHPEGAVTLPLGYGRRNAGRVGGGLGFNAYAVRTSNALLFAPGATLKKTGQTYEFAVTKSHYTDHRSLTAGGDGSGTHSLEGNEALTRGIIRYATLDEFKEHPNFAHEDEELAEDPKPDDSMFSNWRYDKNAWGMAIDMNSCVGCNACVVSCYSENNIAVVGRHNVKTGRIMQWIRIDTYFEGDLDTPKAHFQPMTCQHCENAPCEQVCPVGATVHSPEGLNVMVYNRCVGTRYCSNNCPYKVRRFNFLLYSDYETESLKLGRNPDVTVRSRGVMEKCSYCSQRIAAAKIAADKENRDIRDGEVVTACQQACPTGAITFGNINDRSSKVARLKAQQRNYGVLADLNTRPRTTYIAEVFNPNPDLAEARTEHAPAKS